MTRLVNIVACLFLASDSLSASLPLSNYAQLQDRASAASPCARVRDLAAASLANPATSSISPQVPADLAYRKGIPN